MTDDIRAILIDAADYIVDLVNHEWLSDVPAAARVATAALSTKTSTAGVAGAANLTFSSVSGDPSEALVLYKHTGVETSSALIAWIDTATGLPVTPNGTNINVSWDTGANKIFKL